MKLYENLILSLSLAAVISLAACSTGESPVSKIADGFNTLSTRIEQATSDAQSLEIIEQANDEVGSQMEEIMKEEADYKLTDEDRATLKAAMKRFLESSMRKSMEVSGVEPTGVEDAVESMMQIRVNPQIDAAKTLGDLASGR